MAENTNTERDLMQLGCYLEDRGGVWVVQYAEGGCMPASITEKRLWNALQEARASLSLPAAGQEPVAWEGHARKLTQWLHCMSYNDSYFGEPAGLVKQVTAELNRLIGVRPTTGATKKLWLWKNFVNGKPEYWAFDNPFPCASVGGDPLTFGEPCGWALFKPSVNGRPDRSEQEVTNTVMRLAAAPQPAVAAGWVSVKDRLPPLYKEVLVYPRPTGYCCEAEVDTQGQWSYGEYETNFGHHQIKCNVTHWMPLPPAPSTEGEGNG